MRKVSLAVLTAGLIAFASPVFAGSCPIMIQEIQETLASVELPEETRAQVEALLEEGRALHDEGDHDKSVAILSQAEELLGM